MSRREQPSGKSRWQLMQESTFALASKCETLDPDGITVYTFSSKFKRYDNVTANKVDQIFLENEPFGMTDLASVLEDAINHYFQKKASEKAQPNGETILVVTDGEPDDRKAVMKVIIEASRRMEKDEELGISFIQIGSDVEASRFLKALDDDLQSAGAKFDIVDTVTMNDMGNMTITEVLLNAIAD